MSISKSTVRKKRAGNLHPHIPKGKSQTPNKQEATSLIHTTVRVNCPPKADKKNKF